MFPGFLLGMLYLFLSVQDTDVFYIVYARLKTRATLVCILQSHCFNLLELTLADNKRGLE